MSYPQGGGTFATYGEQIREARDSARRGRMAAERDIAERSLGWAQENYAIRYAHKLENFGRAYGEAVRKALAEREAQR